MDEKEAIVTLNDLKAGKMQVLENTRREIENYGSMDQNGDLGDSAFHNDRKVELCATRMRYETAINLIERNLADLEAGRDVICTTCAKPIKNLERVALGYRTHANCR